MRTSWVILLSAGLLAAGTSGALASDHRGGGHAAASHGHGDGADGNATDDRENRTLAREEARERRADLKAARDEALRSFHENRTRVLEEWRAETNATKAWFHAEKRAVLDACADLRNATAAPEDEYAEDEDENATAAHAHCVRDGLKPLIEEGRERLQAAREAALAELKELRAASLAQFRAAKAEADARHGRPAEA